MDLGSYLAHRLPAVGGPALARGVTTNPPNTCEGGVGVGASSYSIPVPMPALRQN